MPIARTRPAAVACAVLAVAALLLGAPLAARPASAATGVLYVPETGHYVRGVFRDFWDRSGGLANFGFPITEEYVEPGTGRIIQYFERARFERALPSSTAVTLGLLGREVLGGRAFPVAQPIQGSATRRYFPQTGQVVQYGFKQIWETRGGVAVFGLPLSGEVTETTDDGQGRTVQYFERARFEYHPEQPDGRRVILSALGRRLAPPALTAPLPPDAAPAGPLEPPAGQPAPTAGGLARPLVPPAVNAVIRPLAGEPSQEFAFAPTPGFRARETVSVWANPVGGRSPSFIGRFSAGADGALAPVFFTPPAGAALGQWAVVAEGNQSKRQAIGYFLLISGPVGRAQPTATPAPPAPTGTPAPTPVPPTPTLVPLDVDAAVEPASGPAGTVFFFDARGFRAGEEVQVAVIDPAGRQWGGAPVQADERGSIRSAGLFYPTAPGAVLGQYRMVAYGKASGKTSTAFFTVTP